MPGICGTELRDPAVGGDGVVWGLRPKAMIGALVTGSIYQRLADPRLVAGSLLTFPAFLPGLGRWEPYTRLLRAIPGHVRHPDAVLSYPYDWRRPVADVAAELAVDAAEHLRAWRRHPAGSHEATLTIVAHSMGGLIAQRAVECHRGQLGPGDVRQVLTLGTPFGGSVKAVRAMATGEVLSARWRLLPHIKRRLRAFAVQLPSAHDLLPVYPCHGDGTGDEQRPDPTVLVSAGADTDLTRRAMEDRAELAAVLDKPGHKAVTLHPVAGVGQPTLQTFALRDGEVHFYTRLGGRDLRGDGTVYIGAAYPKGTAPPALQLPQGHGAVAASAEILSALGPLLVDGHVGPAQAAPDGDGIGLVAPEAVSLGEQIEIRVVMPEGTTASLTWRNQLTGAGDHLRLGPPTPAGERHVERTAQVAWAASGLYAIVAAGGSASPVEADVLVAEDEDRA